MATTLRRKSSKSVGTTATLVGGYTAPNVTTGVYVTGLIVANTTGNSVLATVDVFDGTTAFNLCVSAPVPAGGSITLADQGNRQVLNSGDGIRVTSNAAASLDANMSVMEIQ